MGYSNVQGALNVLSTTSTQTLVVRGDTALGGNLVATTGFHSFGNVTAANLTVTGNFIITATNTQVTNALSINNAGTSTALKVTQFEGGGPGHSYNVAEFWDFTTLAMVIDPEGNVGIHTTSSPGYSLSVVGGVSIDSVTAQLYSGNGSGLSNLQTTSLVGALAAPQLQALQTNVTQVGTLTGLYASGNVSASFFIGGGNALSNVQSASLVGNVASANVALVVSQPYQPNITSVGLLSNLTVSNSVTTTNIFASGNVVIGPAPTAILANLHVEQGDVFIGNSAITNTNFATTGPVNRLIFDNSANVSVVPNKIVLFSNIAGSYECGLGVSGASSSGAFITYDGRTGHIWYTGATTNRVEQMRLTSGGVLAFGTTNQTAAKLYVAGTISNVSVRIDSSNISLVTTGNAVGFGTLTPSANLHVIGNVFTSNALQTTNVIATTANLVTANATTLLATTANLVTANATTIYAANSVTTTNLVTAGITSNATNTTFSFDTLTIPFIYSTTLNIASTSNIGATVATSLNVSGSSNLTSLTVNGLLTSTNGSGIANLTAASITGNVANANVALVVSQPAQPNITSLGALTGLTVNGLLSSTNGSGIANLTAASITGNVANANVALVVSQPAQPNITSLGALTGLTVNGLLSSTNGSGIANLTAASITGNVANANVALVVSQAAQPNITSVGLLSNLAVSNSVTTGNLIVQNTANVLVANIANIYTTNIVGFIGSQWTTGMGNVYYLTGNVGIGTSTVSANLTVSGNIYASNTITTANDILAGTVRIGRGANLVASDTVLGANVLLNDPGANNTALGYQSMQNAQPFVGYDTAVGSDTLQNDTGPGFNTAIGSLSMLNSSPGAGQDVAVGFCALAGDLGSGYNTAIGTYSMQNANPNGGNDTAVGYYALTFDAGPGYNTAIGGLAMQGASPGGGYDTAVGWQTLLSDTGSYNTAIGANAGQGITGGQYNTALGAGSGPYSASLNYTTAIGAGAQPTASNVAVFPALVNVGINTGAPRANLEVQGNVYVSNSITTPNLTVTSNIVSEDASGNTYLTGNIIVSGNVFSALGTPLGAGGGYYFSLPSDIALQTPYTGAIYGATYPLSVGLSNGFTINGTSTLITVTPNGNFQFGVAGPYLLRAVFNSTDNIKGLAVGSNVADIHGTDQGYMYRYTTFITQNPTELIEIPFNVTDTTKYYYLDLFSVDGGSLRQTANTSGGTYLTITPLQGGGLATGGPGGTPGTQWISSGSNIYYSNSVGVGAVNPGYNLDVVGDIHATGNVYAAQRVLTNQSTTYTATALDYYIGINGTGVTVNLPQGSTLPIGKTYVIKDESGLAATNHITVSPYSGNLIDGQTSLILVINYLAVTLLWTGAIWSIV